ncbi:MAG: hypothetical protein HY300_13525 [Verrucomicrobia bacterium]|nr:hypothetical protein [Verrucomicrobiota bacterium]
MRKNLSRLFRGACWAVLVGLALHNAPRARGELMVPLSVEQLAAKSQLILRGTVTSKTVQRDGAGRIYTSIELQVAEVWKGALATNRFTIVHGGGVLGDRRVTVSGQAEYVIGEEVVAFLLLTERGEGVSIGLAQGKFNVWQDQKTGERLARNLFHGNDSNTPDKAAKSSPANATMQERLTLDILKQRAQGGAK